MKPTSLDEIKAKAYELNESGRSWHIHLLGSSCVFNDRPRCAFVLENPEEKLAWVHYSDQPEKELGKELLLLLHGDNMLDEVLDPKYQPSSEVKAILKQATACNQNGTAWHHHMLFPDCRLNKHAPNYTLTFESDDNAEVLESVTNDEPTNDLKQIESLFYKN